MLLVLCCCAAEPTAKAGALVVVSAGAAGREGALAVAISEVRDSDPPDRVRCRLGCCCSSTTSVEEVLVGTSLPRPGAVLLLLPGVWWESTTSMAAVVEVGVGITSAAMSEPPDLVRCRLGGRGSRVFVVVGGPALATAGPAAAAPLLAWEEDAVPSATDMGTGEVASARISEPPDLVRCRFGRPCPCPCAATDAPSPPLSSACALMPLAASAPCCAPPAPAGAEEKDSSGVGSEPPDPDLVRWRLGRGSSNAPAESTESESPAGWS